MSMVRRGWRLMIVRIYGVYGLSYSEGEEEVCSNKGENSPWISEIGMNEIGTLLVGELLAVVTDSFMHHIEATLWVEGYILGERVEEFGNGFVTTDGILYVPARV